MLRQHEVLESEGSVPDLERIRKSLQSRSIIERKDAEAALNQLTSRELIGVMAAERRRRKIRQRRTIGFVAAYVIIMVAVMALGHNSHLIMYFGGLSGMLAAAMAFSPAHKGAARALAKFDDIAGVGPLVEALEIPDSDVQSAVRESLSRLLKRLHSSDASRLNATHRRILRSQLNARPTAKNSADGPRFVEAALKGLEQVGDESFLESVESLAHGEGFGAFEEVKAAAEQCLPYLRQRIENERLSHDLLRAASVGPVTDPDSLLRPADSAGHTESAQLLRPASSE